MDAKNKNTLTLLLIILIVIIVGIIGYLGFEIINGNVKESQAQEVVDEFDRQIPTISQDDLDDDLDYSEENGRTGNYDNDNDNDDYYDDEYGNNGSSSSGRTGGSSSGNGSSSGGSSSGVYINGLWAVGTIRIPATGIKYPIYADPSVKALENGVGIVYTANGLNQPGNTVIAGHNYRNRLFFSKNKNLVVGDLVMIKDTSGEEITYEIYNKFVTDESDASFYQRDTGGKREINLSTCTDDGTRTGGRIIISARER